MQKRKGLNLLMTALIIAVMSYQAVGNLFHEAAGILLLILFLIHNALNWKWYKNIGKGKYPLRSAYQGAGKKKPCVDHRLCADLSRGHLVIRVVFICHRTTRSWRGRMLPQSHRCALLAAGRPGFSQPRISVHYHSPECPAMNCQRHPKSTSPHSIFI